MDRDRLLKNVIELNNDGYFKNKGEIIDYIDASVKSGHDRKGEIQDCKASVKRALGIFGRARGKNGK